MMRCAPTPRAGVSLLEVIAALVIFLLSYVAISDLINQSAQRAALVELQELATLRCQSKLAEVVAGALPLSSQEGMPYEEDANWTWSLQCEQHGQLAGLWNVTVRVSRMTPEGYRVESILSQMVLDPTVRGSTMDSTTIAGMESTDTGTTTSGSAAPASGSNAPATGGGR